MDEFITAAVEETAPARPKSDIERAREAFTYAWRPAGSMSLAESWLRAGEGEEEENPSKLRRLSPPRPPAPPSTAKLLKRKLKR